LPELSDLLNRAVNLLPRVQVAKLKLGRTFHLAGGKVRRRSIYGNFANPVIRAGYKMKRHVAAHSTFSFHAKIAKTATIMKCQNACANALAIERLADLLRDQRL